MSAIRLPAPATTSMRPAPTPPVPQPTVAAPGPVLTTAETAECTCPEFCERDHANE